MGLPAPPAGSGAPPEPDPDNDYRAELAGLLLASHRRLTGRDLLVPAIAEAPAAACRLYHAPFAVLAHDAGADPRFIYANLAAQRRFALAWPAIVGMPSRLSAEAPARDERQRLLEAVERRGFIDDYRGVRIAADGRRFLIEGATVWNLLAADGTRAGQAAWFAASQDL